VVVRSEYLQPPNLFSCIRPTLVLCINDSTFADTVNDPISRSLARFVSVLYRSSVLEQKPQEGFRNSNPIVLLSRSIQSVSCLLVLKDTLLIPSLYQFNHNLFVKFRVSLHRDEFVLLVHALDQAARRRAKFLDVLWILEDDVFVHLVNGLLNVRRIKHFFSCVTYECILLEDLLALGAQLNG
jgi:hypothetical protein